MDLTVDLKSVPPSEQKALSKLVAAARIMDSLFLRQVWAGNEPMLLRLAATSAHMQARNGPKKAAGILDELVKTGAYNG